MNFPRAKFLSFDVESSGKLPEYALQPSRAACGDSWLTTFAYCWSEDGKKIDTEGAIKPTLADLEKMLDFVIDTNRFVVGWNITFDIAWLIALGFEEKVYKIKWFDAMLFWRHLEVRPGYLNEDGEYSEKQSFRLKENAMPTFFPEYAGYEEDVDYHDTSPKALEKLYTYNKHDIVFTLKIAEKVFNQLEPAQQRAARIEAECLPMVASANVRGLTVNREAVDTLNSTLKATAIDRLAKLETEGATSVVLSSPKKLATLLFDTWGLTPLKNSKVTGAPSTDKESLYEIAFDDPRAQTVRDYREAVGNRKKFATNVLDSMEYWGEDIVRPSAIVFGTYSGRMTYSSSQGRGINKRQTGMALHQMKRGKDFRQIIKAPDGYVIGEFDAAGQEFRLMACASGDATMLDLCAPGEDPHGFMGSSIVRRDYHELVAAVQAGDKSAKDARQLGKVANLSCIAENQKVLTDRGFCTIQHITLQDKLWDGVEWVNHSGVVFNGYREVMTYEGLTATPDHRVLVGENWVRLDKAAEMGWKIESSLGTGWSRKSWATFRILGGIIRRTIRTVRGFICHVPLQMWSRKGGQSQIHGDGTKHTMQKLRDNSETSFERETCCGHAREKITPETCKCYASTVPEQKRQKLSKLWWSWYRVQVRNYKSWGGMDFIKLTIKDIRRSGLRQNRQQRSLCAGESTSCYTQGEPKQQATYDILNAGTRTRFSVGFSIVHNCQYRTSAPKLKSVARVQYQLPMDLGEAKNIRDTYLSTYTGVPVYWRSQIAKCKSLGYVETFAGRRVQLGKRWTRENSWSLESTAINYRIQGTGADMKYLALMMLKPFMMKHGILFYFELHDGIYLLLPEDNYMELAPQIQQILNRLPYESAWGWKPPIQLPWDCKLGRDWGALKETKFD